MQKISAPSPVSLSTPLTAIKGIGPKFAEKLASLDIITLKDALYYLPSRYLDFSQIVKIADLHEGQVATIFGTIESISMAKTWKRHIYIIQATIADETGSIKAMWFNQRFLITTLKKGMAVNIAGKVSSDGKKLYFASPMHEIISHDGQQTRHTGRLVPVYPETRGITSKGIRLMLSKVAQYIPTIGEFLPEEILEKNRLPTISEAFRQAHFPQDPQEAENAHRRFAFQDLFLLQLVHQRERMTLARSKAHAFQYDPEYIKRLMSFLPFELTLAQKKALYEVLEDLKKSHVTNRLLQGDVGSGKTIVCALAALVVAKEGHQTVFMAPTEVLAQQHYATFMKFFSIKDGNEDPLSAGVALVTSSQTKLHFGDSLEADVPRKQILEYAKSGKVRIIIGTHAVIQKDIYFNKLGFVIIDEQHRFGVKQRALLASRTYGEDEHGAVGAHFLSMSATPIPRTLALTAFGDLDLSLINEMPKNRKKIETQIIAPSGRQDAYDFIRAQIREGRQAYVVCPRIEPNDEEKPTGRQLFQLDVRSVKEEYDKLSKKIFPDLRVEMLHGKMKAAEKSDIMGRFKKGEIDILVSTSVIEVGVDVPNATIMMIEGSERFGLSQLYQFRGRVGRGEHQSYCFLFTDSSSKTTQERMKALITAKNGFELAEIDLKLRGPGQFLGSEQTGLPDLAMKAAQNPEMVQSARETAHALMERDPQLKEYPYLAAYLALFKQGIHLE
jgi:ATP-dependent DNA helicase RecG